MYDWGNNDKDLLNEKNTHTLSCFEIFKSKILMTQLSNDYKKVFPVLWFHSLVWVTQFFSFSLVFWMVCYGTCLKWLGFLHLKFHSVDAKCSAHTSTHPHTYKIWVHAQYSINQILFVSKNLTWNSPPFYYFQPN